MTTSSPAKPDFTPDARGNYPCPDCNKAFTRPQGVSRHWNQQHAPDVPDLSDDALMDDLRTMWAEVQAEKNAQDAEMFEEDEPAEATTDDLLTAPGIHVALMSPTDVLHRCRIDTDAALALSDATAGLVDAITRLVAIGYARDEARDIVLDLITKLDGRPA